jgi:L-arabinose isomerase
MKPGMNAATTTVGLVGIGLETYWPQFKGLRERLIGHQEQLGKKLKGF